MFQERCIKLRSLVPLVCSITHIADYAILFWNDSCIFSERFVNLKVDITKFEWSCAANCEVIRHLC